MSKFFESLPTLDEIVGTDRQGREKIAQHVADTLLHPEKPLADRPYHKDSDRGMSLNEWQDWIVDLLIKKHDEGLSDNQLRMMFAAEFDRRYGTPGEGE